MLDHVWISSSPIFCQQKRQTCTYILAVLENKFRKLVEINNSLYGPLMAKKAIRPGLLKTNQIPRTPSPIYVINDRVLLDPYH